MTQIARPFEDVTPGTWNPRPVFAQIDEQAPDDADFVFSPDNPAGDAFEVKLPRLAWPRPGAQRLTVRLRKTIAGSVPATVRLLQGTKLIAYRRPPLGTSFADAALDLTDAEVRAITDYTDLRLKVTAGIETVTGCSACPAAPKYWELTIAGVTNGSCSDCAKVNGRYTLSHESGCTWLSNSLTSICAGSPFPWELKFNGSVWQLRWSTLAEYRLAPASWNCLGSNTLSLFSSTGACTNWPATVTVDPL